MKSEKNINTVRENVDISPDLEYGMRKLVFDKKYKSKAEFMREAINEKLQKIQQLDKELA